MSFRSRLRLPRLVISRFSLVLVTIVLLILATVGLLSVTRDTPVSVVLSLDDGGGPPAIGTPAFARTMELFTGLHLGPGTEVTQALNGDGTYPGLWRDLRSARETITVQMYYSQPGAVADTMAAILAERAKAGVNVLLLLDAFGSQNLTDEWHDALRAAGVKVELLRPLHWYTLHKAANRSHVRVVVVDGRIGYTGGFGLADYWLGDGRSENEWRESNVRFRGPAVNALQAAFATAWAEVTGVLLTGQTYYPDWPDAVDSTAAPPADTVPAPDSGAARPATLAGLLFTQPTDGSTAAERFLALTIAGATQRLWIANSYFVPNDDFKELLERAARRGVDVRILTVSDATDVATTRYAGRARFESLLEAGVRIFEYQPTMMHGKTIVADGYFATIGSMNFDNRSLAFNSESSLVVLDSAFAREMERTYEEDLRHSKEILLPEFRQRGAWQRVLETGATLLTRLL
jgi:cardiolipin synthase